MQNNFFVYEKPLFPIWKKRLEILYKNTAVYLFKDARISAVISSRTASWSSFSAERTVRLFYRTVISFISPSIARMILPDCGAQEPFSMMDTVRFCTFRAFISSMKFAILG